MDEEGETPAPAAPAPEPEPAAQPELVPGAPPGPPADPPAAAADEPPPPVPVPVPVLPVLDPDIQALLDKWAENLIITLKSFKHIFTECQKEPKNRIISLVRTFEADNDPPTRTLCWVF